MLLPSTSFLIYIIIIIISIAQTEGDGIVEIRRGIQRDIQRTTETDGDNDKRERGACNFVGTIVFGGPFSLQNEDKFFVLGSSQLVGYLLVVDYVNQFRCGIRLNGENYALQLRTYDDQSSVDQSKIVADYIVADPDVDFVLGGYSSGLTEPLAEVATNHSRLLLAPGAAATSVFSNRDQVFGILPPSSNYIIPAVEGLASVGAKTIATVWEDAAFTREACSSAPSLAEKHGLNMTSAHEIEGSPTLENVLLIAEEVAKEDPDVVITCVYDDGCKAWMEALKTIDWSPRAQVFTVCVGFQQFARDFGTDAEYIMGVTPWDPSLQLEDSVTGWSASDFGRRYLLQTADEDVKYQSASAAAVISVAIQAIEATNSTNDMILSEYIATNSFQTIYGKITFDENGQSQAPTSLIQYDANGIVQSVFPTETASGAILYPMPSWGQRDCAHLSVCESGGGVCGESGECICSDVGFISVNKGTGSRCIPPEEMNFIQPSLKALGYAMVAIILFISLVCLGWVFVYRANPLVRFSQPLFMVLLVIGCVTSILSILPLGAETGYPDESDDIQVVDLACMSVPWLWGIGFSITFSAIFAKVRRIKKIYKAGIAMRRKPVNVRDVLSTVVVIVALEVAILLTWQLVSPLRWERHILADIDGHPMESVGECTSENGWWFFLTLVLFNILCLFYALILCFQTKDLPTDFAESSHIFLAVMFMFQILVLSVPVSAMVREQTEVFYFIRACAIFLQNVTVLIIIFAPKMVRVWKGEDTLDHILRNPRSRHSRGSRTEREFTVNNNEPGASELILRQGSILRSSVRISMASQSGWMSSTMIKEEDSLYSSADLSVSSEIQVTSSPGMVGDNNHDNINSKNYDNRSAETQDFSDDTDQSNSDKNKCSKSDYDSFSPNGSSRVDMLGEIMEHPCPTIPSGENSKVGIWGKIEEKAPTNQLRQECASSSDSPPKHFWQY